jgi:hypothetical protein
MQELTVLTQAQPVRRLRPEQPQLEALRQPLAVCPDFDKYHIMILNELYNRSPQAYQDLEQDNSQPRLGNLRKTRLTLRQLSKLRQMNDVRSVEYKEKLKNIRKQYAPPPAPPAL